MPAFPPRLKDLTPGSPIDIVIQTTQYTGLFNAAGVPCTAQERTSQHRGRCPLLAEVDPATFVPAALRVTSAARRLTRWPRTWKR